MPCPTCGRAFDPCPFCRAGAGLRRGPVAVAAVVQPVPLAPGALPLGAVLGFACKRHDVVAAAHVASGSILYVLRNTQVEFRAHATGLAQGLVINFDTAVWGGSAGAAGTAAMRQVNFPNNAGANAAINGVTVTVAFGGQNATVTIIVFELRTTAAIADNFAGRAADDLGVDERVALDFASTPPGVTAIEAGGLRWRLADRTAPHRDTVGLFHDPATHLPPVGNLGAVDYVAPCRTYPHGSAPVPRKLLTLKLEIMAGVCAGLGPERAYTICHPTAHMREVAGHRTHTQGTASAGFGGEIFLTPKNVSFRTLRIREANGAMTVSGTFPAIWQGLVHQITAFPDNVVGTVAGGDINNGCVANGQDTVSSGEFGYVVPPFASPLTEVGTESWPIEWQYTYPTLLPAVAGWANVWIGMQRAHHTAKMYQTGAMAIFKGHIGCATHDCMAVPIRAEFNDPTIP